jgi:hypothetical protein
VNCYTVAANTADLATFLRQRLTPIKYSLFPDNSEFIILFSDELYIAAGPREFVEEVMGRPVATAREEFAAVVKKWSTFNEHARRYFTDIQSYYESSNGL